MLHEIQINGIIFTVEVTKFYGGLRAKTWGAPENCYPEESPEIEFEIVGAIAYDEDDNEYELDAEGINKALDSCDDELYDAVMVAHREYMASESEYC